MKNAKSFVPSNLREMWKQWLTPLKYHEISLIVSYPGNDNIRRIDQMIVDNEFVSKSLGINGKVEWIKLDYRISKWVDCDQMMSSIGTRTGDASIKIFLLRGFELLMREGRTDLIMGIQDIYRFQNIRVLLVCDNNYYDPDFERILLSSLSFQPRIGYLPEYAAGQAHEFVEYLSGEWKMEFTEKVKDIIYQNCGGNLGFVREVAWYLRDKGVDEIEQALTSQQLLWQIRSWWTKLSNSDREYLRYLVFGLDTRDISPMTKDYMSRIGVVNTRVLIKAELIVNYVRRYEVNPKSIGLIGEQIIIGGLDYASYFTQKQRQILTTLISRKNEIVQRNILMELIWGEASSSDWAFDNQINRLRKRLKELGLKASHLQTKRGKGLIWQE